MKSDTLEAYREAGRIAKQARTLGIESIQVGESMKAVLDNIESLIEKSKAIPAFPPQISVNEVAAHYYPGEEDYEFKEGDVCKLDVGVAVKGYIADTAKTKILGDDKGLLRGADACLSAALEDLSPETKIGEIGRKIQVAAEEHGFNPVRNLTGHGLDRWEAHTPPTIPNIATNNENAVGDNVAFAIEPFVTPGTGEIKEAGTATLFEQRGEARIRNRMIKPVYKDIQRYDGLPFASRHLAEKHGWPRTRYALKQLVTKDVLVAHPSLVEVSDGLVAQAEHTVVISDGEVHVTTR